MPRGVINAQDEAAYGEFIAKIQGADSQAAYGMSPALVAPAGIDNDYFIRGLESLHNPPIRGVIASKSGLMNYLQPSSSLLKVHSG